MSIIRPTLSFQAQPKTGMLSTQQRNNVESLSKPSGARDSVDKNSSDFSDSKQIIHESTRNYLKDYHATSEHGSLVQQQEENHQSALRFYTDKDEEDSSVTKGDEASQELENYQPIPKKETSFVTQGIGFGLSSVIPISTNETSPATTMEASSQLKPTSFDAISSALSAVMPYESSEGASVSTISGEDPAISQGSKSEEGEGMGSALLASSTITASSSSSSGNVGAPAALGNTLPAPVAAAVRTARFSDFLSELTATVTQARLDGPNMTLQLRSDVLEGTNVNITADATHMEVVFSTINAASNAVLTSNLTSLQNHLIALCPGQIVDVKNQFVPSATLSNFDNKDEKSKDDLASFDQGNRGNFRNDDDSL